MTDEVAEKRDQYHYRRHPELWTEQERIEEIRRILKLHPEWIDELNQD